MTPNAYRPFRRLAALVAVAGLLSLTVGQVAAQRENAVPAKADARTITHVLNRIGFGPRPGDVERVQQMGLPAYIDQQLNPVADRGRGAGRAARAIPDAGDEPGRARARMFAPARPDARGSSSASRRAQPPPPAMRTDADDDTPPPATPPRQPPPPEQRMLQQAAQNVHERADAGQDAARRDVRAAARGSARRFLVQPLQRVHREGPGPAVPDRVRARRRFARTCSATSASCSARRRRARRCCSTWTTSRARRRTRAVMVGAGDDRRGAAERSAAARPDSGRTGSWQRLDQHAAAAAAPAARPQRELRARADGAAHARRRRRLHAAGRHRGGAHPDGLDDRSAAARRQLRVPARRRTTPARRSCSARSSRRAKGRKRASARWTCWRGIRRRRSTSPSSSRSASSPTSRRRRSSIAPRRSSRTRRATCAK